MVDYAYKDNSEWNEFYNKISFHRNIQELNVAISYCKQAIDKFPDSYFYYKILGDLLYQVDNYNEASHEYILYLNKIPANEKLFTDFAKRYYRLKRNLSDLDLQNFAGLILAEIASGRINLKNADRARELIIADLPKAFIVSEEGLQLIDIINKASSFVTFIGKAKSVEAINPVELEHILDKYILSRNKSLETYRIDAYCISIYEKMGRGIKSLKLSEDLLKIKIDSVVIRSIFRICRESENYDFADKILEKYPSILKSDDFNILYELVYYHEHKNDENQLSQTLKNIEKYFNQSLPIQKTLRNFYIRFGMINDVKRLDTLISELYKAGRKVEKFSEQITESETEISSKIQELYSELEYQKQLAAISDLTTGISHELGQPITNIRYTIQFYRKVFERNLSKENLFKVFDSVLEETERMGGLIKRLSPLTSSKNVSEKFDVIDRIKKRVSAEIARLNKSKIRVNLSPDSPIYIVGDPVKLDQLISNLLLNSIDAIDETNTKTNNRIVVEVSEYENDIKLIFSDNGAGIPIKNRGKIFDPFFSTKAPGKGEGLGLFIVWNIIKLFGGKIVIDSKYNNGARFIISLPKIITQAKES